jgi:hypothetical protein
MFVKCLGRNALPRGQAGCAGQPCRIAPPKVAKRTTGRISVSCRVKWAVQESLRDSVSKPRVARNEPPWVIIPNSSQPQRGCGHSVSAGRSPRPQRRWRCGYFRPWIQGSPEKSGQPWAEGRNPFGIEPPDYGSKLRCAPCHDLRQTRLDLFHLKGILSGWV